MQDQKNKPDREDRHEYVPGVQEKATIGGAYNTGVTSDDPQEKEEIEKKGSLAQLKPKEDKQKDEERSNSQSTNNE
jgi:hypothetical protein